MALMAVLLPGSIACASTPQPADAQAGADSTAKLMPAGYGTLREDEFTISLRSGPLLIKVTPLNEAVIRTAAPDTYDRLHKMADSRRAEAERRAGAAPTLELFKVSFFSYDPDVEYQPEGVQITHQGRQLRAAALLPLTTAFGRQRLKQQETQTALYAFATAIDYQLPITVRYNMDESDAWGGIIPKLEIERAKILARVKN
jgi:hypothetical protein